MLRLHAGAVRRLEHCMHLKPVYPGEKAHTPCLGASTCLPLSINQRALAPTYFGRL